MVVVLYVGVLKKQNGKIIPESEKISETAQETGTMNCCRK